MNPDPFSPIISSPSFLDHEMSLNKQRNIEVRLMLLHETKALLVLS
jgi:hypothetical protein